MIIYRGGSSLVEDFYVTDNAGDAVDITGDTLKFYLKSSLLDEDANALLTTAVAVIDGPTGHARLTLAQSGLTTLSDRYYPYIVKRTSGAIVSYVDSGVLNVNQIQNQWEWDVDILDGVSLSDILGQANTLLRYRDWDTSSLTEWVNDGVKDWCKRTNYLVSRATILTKKSQTTYTLPRGIITIRTVYLDGVKQYRNRQWIRENNSIIFLSEPEGNQELMIICSKYAQSMDNVNQYAEIVEEGTEGLVYYVCWKAKLEDREFSEADYYYGLYNDYTNDYMIKNTIDSTEETQLTYAGQGTTNMGSQFSDIFSVG
jgi:hypothetical protein